MTGRRRLFIPGYYSGYSNNKMSLDIAIVLAYLTDRVLVPYRFRLPRRFPLRSQPDQVLEPMLVPHLFDIPIPWSDEYLFKTWISLQGAVECAWAPIRESVLCFPDSAPPDDERFGHFRNGRRYVYSFGERENEAPDLHINTQTLGLYSYFAYLDDERRRAVVDLMRRVRPKRQYLDAAERIAAGLGSFNAVHIRRDDFVSNALSQEKITRAASISGQEIVANLASRMDRDVPLVICTDGSSREEIFGPIQKHFRETIFLDRYLRESASVRELLAGLPQEDESVDALVTQLVASKAQVFAGTLFSTFTGLIHRMRAFDRQETSFLYCYNDILLPLVRYERWRIPAGRRRTLHLEPDPLPCFARRLLMAARVAGGSRRRATAVRRRTATGGGARASRSASRGAWQPDSAPGRRRRPDCDRRLERSGRVRKLGSRSADRWNLRSRDPLRLRRRRRRQPLQCRRRGRRRASRAGVEHRQLDIPIAVVPPWPAPLPRQPQPPDRADQRDGSLCRDEPQRDTPAAAVLAKPLRYPA